MLISVECHILMSFGQSLIINKTHLFPINIELKPFKVNFWFYGSLISHGLLSRHVSAAKV